MVVVENLGVKSWLELATHECWYLAAWEIVQQFVEKASVGSDHLCLVFCLG